MINKKCYIVGAGDSSDLLIADRESSFVIAADGGMTSLKNYGVSPDLTVGDFDSLTVVPVGNGVIKYPCEKDDTDMMIAVKEGLIRGCNFFYIFGGMGGRLDHTLANLQMLSFIAERGAIGFLFGNGVVASTVKNSALLFEAGKNGIISVFAADGTATGVYLYGLKSGLQNAAINCRESLGVSNEFTGKKAEVRVENGTLTVLWYDTPENIINGTVRLLSDQNI